MSTEQYNKYCHIEIGHQVQGLRKIIRIIRSLPYKDILTLVPSELAYEALVKYLSNYQFQLVA